MGLPAVPEVGFFKLWKSPKVAGSWGKEVGTPKSTVSEIKAPQKHLQSVQGMGRAPRTIHRDLGYQDPGFILQESLGTAEPSPVDSDCLSVTVGYLGFLFWE